MLITLLTDFGLTDEFAGVMKGVILGICPQARVVDLSHGIEPGGIYQAGLMLAASYPYFPLGTVHCAVVDSGVGSKRKIIAASHGGHFFVAPDNGLLALALADNPPQSAVIVENSAYFLNPVSATFHGRDIFAPVAAYLAKGVALKDLGPAIDWQEVMSLPFSRASVEKGKIIGSIVAADRFGNLISNVSAKDLRSLVEHTRATNLEFNLSGKTIFGLSRCYSDAAHQSPVAVIGSRGYLEIAVRNGSAQKFFGAKPGAEIWAMPGRPKK
ncbi:MAG: SAM-dependent chlorinase/fluorinase [Desulfatibacillaceae bacterium]|nr:SAM-dependent chlorinase/fluorinase [Desulfatibacillaceae bacterium]